MKKLIIYTIVILLTGLSACKKILDKVDLNGIPEEQVWATDGTAELYLNTLYSLAMPVYYSNGSSTSIPSNFHNISDECNGGTNTGVIQGTLTTESVSDFFASGTAGYYPYIRKINYLLNDIDGGSIDKATVAKIKAQAYFLRAWCYFQLWKTYGGVPYITKAQDYILDSLNVPRNSSSQCVDSMLADLSHCNVLPTTWSGNDQGRISSVASLALKGRILLYWASPQFNPNNDQSRWDLAYAANKTAMDSLTGAGYALHPNFSTIFLQASTSKEVIFARSYNGTTVVNGLVNNWENAARPYSMSSGGGGKSYNPTWELVKAFPMADGYAPANASATYPYNDTFYWKNRDPRFYATIVYNGAIYGLNATVNRKQWMYPKLPEDNSALTTTGFYCRKNIDTTVSPANAQFGKTWWVEMRLGEIMLNFAECANADGHQDEAYTMLVNLRKRAGIKPNSDNLYGLTAGLSQAQMETAILAERRIELAFEDKRYDDLRRTRTWDLLNGTTRSQLVITLNNSYISSADPKDTAKVNNMEHLVPGTGIKMRDTIDVNNPVVYKKFFSTAIAPITGEKVINFLPNYYFYAIPSSNISKQPAMQQTVGWNFAGSAGTFDPTK